MKKQALKRAIPILLVLVLLVSSFAGCKKKQEASTPDVPEQKTQEQLLGFESYEELTGAKLAMGNMLGSIEINTDMQYVTQGSSSIKVSVQGEYGAYENHPYLKLDFLNTTCATCDFSKFRAVSFDVYNACEEEVRIKVSVNVGKEDGNYIGTAKETFVLKPHSWTTCTYDLSKMAGFSIYDFTSVRYLTVEFIDHKQSREDAPKELYIDNLMGTYFAEGEQPEVITYDFYEGIDFETAGKELLFTGQGQSQDASFERAHYETLGIPAPDNGGSYGLRLSHETNFWPTFRINFGRELKAGTIVSFDAYGRISGESLYNQSIFEYSDGGDATVQFKCDGWTKLSFPLKKDCSYVDLFWNYDRAGITSDKASGEVFIDNVIVSDPIPPIEPEGNLWEGLDFEIIGNAGLFTGQKIEGDERRDATIEHVAYSDLSIPALTDGGEYALRLSHDSNYWPTFRINFGEVLPKGTIITFQAYARITTGASRYNQSIFEYSKGGEATDQFKCDAWTELTMELPEAGDHVDLFWNYDRAGITSASASAEVYIDNMIATPGIPPITPVGKFLNGLDFEIIGNVGYFTGQEVNKDNDAQIQWVSYDSVNIPALENGGSHLMKLGHSSFFWPAFRMSFDTTLPAGTKISFMAYGTIQGETLYNQSIFEFTDGGEATQQFPCDAWTKLTITLPKAASYVDLFWNYDRAGVSEGTSGAVYIDNMIATLPVVAEGDFTEGVGFEKAGNIQLFGAVGGDNAWRDAILERISYADAGILSPTDGGQYAMRITCVNSQWPVFRIKFGKTLKAGTVIDFKAYTRDLSDPEKNSVSIFESIPGESYLVNTVDSGATMQYPFGSWNTQTIVLGEDRDYIDLVCNMDRWNEPGPANLEVYVDDFMAVEPVETPEPVGDFTEGIDFETAGNEYFFTGTGGTQDATIERVTYADAGVTALENGGDYALKVSHENNCWPSFRVSFGKTLKAGTTVTFDVYGDYDYDAGGATKYVKIELTADAKTYATSEDPNQVLWTVVQTWRTGVSVTLTADADHVDFFYNVADGSHGDVASRLLLDNFKAVEPTEPEVPTIDFTAGVDFEENGEEEAFAGITDGTNVERVTYADTGVTAPENGGDYALKVSHGDNCWPNFRVNFGKTLKAGTVITFDVYGNYDYAAAPGVHKYVKLEIAASSKAFATSEDPNQVLWTVVQTWRTATITLTADSDHVDFFYNVADGSHGDVASRLLLDNFKAVEPGTPDEPDVPDEPTIDFTAGVDFEKNGEEEAFAGITDGTNVERVTYADTGVTAPENGGDYALKVSHANHCWPSFRVSFGKTLKAGTTISFDVYGNYDYTAPQGVNKYVKLEIAASSKGVATSEDPNQVLWTLVETWKTATITLTADTDHVDFFYNVADGSHGDVASRLMLDNFKAVEPGTPDEPDVPDEPDEPANDFVNGVDFETAGDEAFFTGTGAAEDATIERVTYADAGVTAPENGGSYALKVSHANHCWPSFRVSFGKTLKAGTVITFDAYGSYDYAAAPGVHKYVKLEIAASSKSVATSEDPNQVLWTLVETWKTGVSFTLTADTDHVDFFYNVADGSHGDVASWLLLDNFKAVEPEETSNDFVNGVGFEADGNETYFTGTGAPQDATIQRVTYADAGVTAPENGGSYALKVSHGNHCWPSFRINFGSILKAGTVITFDAYGNYDYAAAPGVYKYVKLEIAASSKSVAASEDPNQVLWTLVETWKTGVSFTLTADTDHVDFFYNVADGSHGDVPSWLLLDNFKAVEPS